MMKKIALALLLAFTLFPAASFAQVVVRIGPPPPVCMKTAVGHRIGVTCGSTAITAGKATVTSGLPAAGSVHPVNTSVGLRTGGSAMVTITRCRKDTGGRLHSEPTEKRGTNPAFLLLQSCPVD
jgi:hypothetical protein